MDIVKFNIVFDKPNKSYYTGQTLTGRVNIVTSSVKQIKGIVLKIKGKAECKWYKPAANHHIGRRLDSKRVTYRGREVYMENEMMLCGGTEGRFELPVGEHTFSFAVMIPNESPSSFSGTHGHVLYYAKAKILLPFRLEEKIKQSFTVIKLLDINDLPELQDACESKIQQTFGFWCWSSGLFTMTIYIPKTGFAKSESIPITVEADNNSEVKIPSIYAYLKRVVIWKAGKHHKHEFVKLQRLLIGSLDKWQTQTWREIIMEIPQTLVPSSESNHIINIAYELHIKASVSGMHTDLHTWIPLSIGDTPFSEDPNVSITDSNQQDYEFDDSERPPNCTSIPFPFSQDTTEDSTNNPPSPGDSA